MDFQYTPKYIFRFWLKIDKSSGENGCWLWTAYRNKCGYGVVYRGDHPCLAHRVAYELANGPIPEGLHACHRCDMPACCNPAHIFLGTPMDNMRDRDRKGRNVAPRGEANGMAKYSDALIEEIRRAYAPGKVGYYRLAKMFGVSRGHVRRIVRRQTRIIKS